MFDLLKSYPLKRRIDKHPTRDITLTPKAMASDLCEQSLAFVVLTPDSDLLFTNVVSVYPAIIGRTVLCFKEDVLVVFSGHDFHAWRHLSRFGPGLL